MNSLIEAIKSGLRNLSKPKSGIQNTLSPKKEAEDKNEQLFTPFPKERTIASVLLSGEKLDHSPFFDALYKKSRERKLETKPIKTLGGPLPDLPEQFKVEPPRWADFLEKEERPKKTFEESIVRASDFITDLVKFEKQEVHFPLIEEPIEVTSNKIANLGVAMAKFSLEAPMELFRGLLSRAILEPADIIKNKKSIEDMKNKEYRSIPKFRLDKGFIESKEMSVSARVNELKESGIDDVLAYTLAVSESTLDLCLKALGFTGLLNMMKYITTFSPMSGRVGLASAKVEAEKFMQVSPSMLKDTANVFKEAPKEVQNKMIQLIADKARMSSLVLAEYGPPTVVDRTIVGTMNTLDVFLSQTDLSKLGIKNIGDLFKFDGIDYTPEVTRAMDWWKSLEEAHAHTLPDFEALPGYRTVRGQARPIGLSLEEVERVGGEEIIKKTTKQATSISDDLAKLKPQTIEPQIAETNLIKEAEILRGTKGMTADDIMATYPNIKLKRDIPATTIYGVKTTIKEGEKLTPYELKGNKILLQDGKTYIVSKNQFQNIKGQSVLAEGKPFAPELEQTEETILGQKDIAQAVDMGDEEAYDSLPNNVKKILEKYGDADGDYTKLEKMTKELKKVGYETDYSLSGELTTLYKQGEGKPTKYSQYTLPGGENYREILIKAPVTKYNTGSKYDEYGYLTEEEKSANSATFKSPHWDEPNVISHIRLNDRTYKGKKVTFMEELQSDWAREGREKGFTNQQAQKEFDDYSKLLKDKYSTTNPTLNATPSEITKYNDLLEKGRGVLSHPLLKNWQELSIKRALKDAVDNNSDYFAWITGEQTSARYNLATHVENVNWGKGDMGAGKNITIKAKEGKTIQLAIDKSGIIETRAGTYNVPSDWNGKKLDEVLGKGLADKIMEKESGTLSGEGLKFGGEWASNLYDRQVKNIVEKLTGQKVEMLDMGLAVDKRATKWRITKQKGFEMFMGIKITPEVKNKIKGIAPEIKTSGKMFEVKTEEIKSEIPKPSVVSGETFEFAGNQVLATAAEKKAIETAIEKAEKLTPGQQEQRIETLENLDLFQGNTEMIEAELEYRNLSPEDMSLVILEDGNKLSDIKYIIRNDNGSLATTITKEEIETLKSTYTGEVADGYVEQTALSKSKDIATGVVSGFRVPYVFFKVKGLSSIYDPLIAGERASVIMVDDFLTRFKDSGLFKKGGIFTADSFNISKKEASDITKYYYDRQFGGLDFPIEKLSEKAQDFIKVFDGITNDTLKGAQEAASIYGKDIIPIPNYAPMYASKDIKFVGEAKKMWTTTEHPYFASLLERKPNVPLDVYEQDYRKTALEYMRQVSTFVNMAEPILHTKNLLENEEFSRILNDRDYDIVKKWFQDVYEGKSQSDSAKAITTVLQYGRRAGSLAYLGGRYSTVLKQPLNLVATSFAEGMLPKLKSKYAKDFNIEVKKLPSYVARAGDIAIEDLQGRVGRIFTGALTEMDREVAFVNLNAFLDREYNKFIEKGIPVTEEVQRFIEKEAQDMLDLWHGGFLEGQRPEYYRSEAGKLVLMFTYQLASQANGFYFKALSEGVFGAENTGVFKEILEEKSKGKLNKDKLKTITSILAGFLAIGYLEQVITNLSFEWSTPDEMAKDVLEASLGNIPAISGISYSLATGKDVTLSPVFGMVSELFNAIYKGDLEEISWASGNFFGVPKQIKKTKEGLEVLASGGLTDKNGQMLAPVEGVMEQIRTFLNGRYGSVAAKDYMNNNPLNKKEGQERRWFVPQVEFLQNGDYERKAELYLSFSPKDRFALKKYLTSGQKKKLDKAIEEHKKKRGGTLGVPASFR